MQIADADRLLRNLADEPGLNVALVVTRAAPVGGAQIHVRDLALAMRAHGHSPTVLTGGAGTMVDDLRAGGIPVVVLRHLIAPMRPARDMAALREIRGVLARVRPELIAAHSAKAGILGRLAARSLGLPAVVTVHGWACAPGTPTLQATVSRWTERLLGSLASKLITVSEFDRRFGLETRIVAADRMVTIHNGIPDIAPQLRADPGRSPARMVMVARFDPQKDQATLLRALGMLKALPWELDLVGEGPLMGEMQSLATGLGIGDRVRFLGQRTDVQDIIARAQVGALVTNWEGFPLSVLEAMRAGLPTVASDVGGVGEAIVDQETGYLVPRAGVDVLRDRLERLLTDRTLRLRLGANGRSRYEQHFTLDRMVAKTINVYRQVLGQVTGRTAEASHRVA